MKISVDMKRQTAEERLRRWEGVGPAINLIFDIKNFVEWFSHHYVERII